MLKPMAPSMGLKSRSPSLGQRGCSEISFNPCLYCFIYYLQNPQNASGVRHVAARIEAINAVAKSWVGAGWKLGSPVT